mgnify:FL=1
MTKHKHLTLSDRNDIQLGLERGETFKAIGQLILKDPTTVSKEVKQNKQIRDYTSNNLPCLLLDKAPFVCNDCHDMKLFKMSRRSIGQAGKILADSGYQGIMKMYSQAQTPRKSSKLKPLTLEDKSYNHMLSKERIKVENIFDKVKTFKMFSTTSRNQRKRFGLRMNLIAGIINCELEF